MPSSAIRCCTTETSRRRTELTGSDSYIRLDSIPNLQNSNLSALALTTQAEGTEQSRISNGKVTRTGIVAASYVISPELSHAIRLDSRPNEAPTATNARQKIAMRASVV